MLPSITIELRHLRDDTRDDTYKSRILGFLPVCCFTDSRTSVALLGFLE
jgi:hypothetical protein